MELPARRVLVFNSCKRLVAIFGSGMATAKAMGIHPQSVYNACVGRNVATQKHYFRHLQDDIEVTNEDLGVLNVVEYDNLCGVERKVYPTNKMKSESKTKKQE